VLQWAFGGPRGNIHALENHRPNHVVYTSTHDTDTALGWYRGLGRRQRQATGLDAAEPHWGMIELALRSRAKLAIVPAQDVLGLGSEARMNRPGEVGGNWSWRLEPRALTPGLAARLRAATERGKRV
jgi:4-alpha-glucanotransferase